jgi:calcineurin-like phosphoesterase
MTGPYDSILGRRIDRVLTTTFTFLPTSFDVAEGDVRLAGAMIEVDRETGRASHIQRLMLRDADVPPLAGGS